MTQKEVKTDTNKARFPRRWPRLERLGKKANKWPRLECLGKKANKDLMEDDTKGYAYPEIPTDYATEEGSMRDMAPAAKASIVDSPPAFPVTDTQKCLIVPLAREWREGMIIRDHGAFVAKVLCHERLGRLKSGNPVLRVTLADENDDITAVVTRTMAHGLDVYEISSAKPNFPGQVPLPYIYMYKDLHDRNHKLSVRTSCVYPFAQLCRTRLGGVHTLKLSQDDKKVIMQSKNRTINWMVLCCPFALILSPYVWMFAFYRGGRRPRRKEPVIVRDQDSRQLQIQAGESMLLAICVSYAVDRMTAKLL